MSAGAHPDPRKASYYEKDLQDWARLTGIRIGKPPVFPVRAVAVMRCALAADEEGKLIPFARAAFETYWGDLEDISQAPVLSRVAERAGLDCREASGAQRSTGDQRASEGEYRRGDRAGRLRLAHHVRQRQRHVFRQRPAGAGRSGIGGLIAMAFLVDPRSEPMFRVPGVVVFLVVLLLGIEGTRELVWGARRT